MKGKQLLLSIIGLLLSVAGNAQLSGSTDYNIWNVAVGDTVYVFSNTANIRAEAGLKAMVTDSLTCGSSLIITEKLSPLDQVKGIYAPWVKARYLSSGATREGYIWMGLLALGHFQHSDANFVYGIDRIMKDKKEEDYHVPESWFLKIKALNQQGRLIDEQEWKMEGPEVSGTGGKFLGDMGLKNTVDVLRINLGGEACGIPTHYFYYGWTGKKLLPLPGKMNVGDAGVYYYEETLLFPKESGGQPDKIIRLTKESEALEEMDKHGEPVFKTTSSREEYLWNGTKAIKKKK